jgi:hypothetical protein
MPELLPKNVAGGAMALIARREAAAVALREARYYSTPGKIS